MRSEDREISLRIFGGPELNRKGERVRLSPQQGALLGVLYGAGKTSLLREEVLAVFWPDDDPPRARKRLNQLLYSIKQKTDGQVPFEARGDTLAPAHDLVASDLQEFEAALDEGALLTCSELLERGFLAETPAGLGRDLQDWIEARSGELRTQLRRKADALWHEGSRTGSWREALKAAEVLLALAPQDEARLRRVLEAMGKAGFSEGAEAALEEFGSAFNDAGGVSWRPDKKTEALLERIRSAEAVRLETTAGAFQDAFPEPPLLGRDDERDLLRRTLRRPPHQALRGILVTGEAGIGKTRILQEVLKGIPVEGQGVFTAGSAELEQLIPLNPLIEAFSGQKAGTVLRGLDEPWRTVLYGVMPGHYQEEGPIPEPPQIQPGSVPRRLFEAFHKFLLALTTEDPAVVVFEDLQWADQTTLSILEFLIRRWDEGGLQLVFTVRSEEIRRNKELGQFLETVRLHEDFLEVPLSDLTPVASEALIRDLSPGPLSSNEVAYLRSLAGGNPFFLIELTLEFLAGRVDAGVPDPEELTIPLSIRQVLERRWAQLSGDSERILEALAVHSRPLDIRGLARVARVSGSRCLSSLDQLQEFRLVATRTSEVMIRHELIRQAVYQRMSDPRKALLHDRVGRLILRRGGRLPYDELAVHFHRAGAKEEARTYSTEAANKAEASGAIAEALRFLRIAREHSEDPHEVAELIRRMGHLNYLHQNLEEAAPLLELAAQRLRRQGEIAAAMRAEVELVDSLAKTGSISPKDCIEEIKRLKAQARRSEEWSTLAKALDVEVHRLYQQGDLEGVKQVILETRQFCDFGGPDARCKTRSILALNVYFGSAEEGLSAAREAVAIARGTQDTDLQLHAINRLLVVLLYQGLMHTDEGQSALATAEAKLGNCGDLILKFNIRLNRAVWHLEAGELDHASSAFEKARDVVKGTKAKDALAVLAINEGECHLLSHNLDFATASFEAAEQEIGPASPLDYKTVVSAGLGLCALRSGDLGEARRREAEMPPLPEFWMFDPSVVASFKAQMLKKRGDWQAADELLESIGSNVRSRLLTAWMKITLERCYLLKLEDRAQARTLAEEGFAAARRVGMHVRADEFSSLLEDLR